MEVLKTLANLPQFKGYKFDIRIAESGRVAIAKRKRDATEPASCEFRYTSLEEMAEKLPLLIPGRVVTKENILVEDLVPGQTNLKFKRNVIPGAICHIADSTNYEKHFLPDEVYTYIGPKDVSTRLGGSTSTKRYIFSSNKSIGYTDYVMFSFRTPLSIYVEEVLTL